MKGKVIGKYVIIDSKKFIRFLLLLALAFTLTIYLFVNAIDSIVLASTSRELTEGEIEFIDEFDLVEVTVSRGDTSWIIQKKMTPDEDVRKMLYYGEKINGKNMGEIKEGETILFLKSTELGKGEIVNER